MCQFLALPCRKTMCCPALWGHYFILGNNVKNIRTCKINGCNEKHFGKGLCHKHYDKQYLQDNKEKVAKIRKRYAQKHKAYFAEKSRKYYKKHKKEKAEYNKRYYKQYSKDNKERIAKKARQYRLANREHNAKLKRQYRKTPLGRLSMKTAKANRRALIKGLTLAIARQVYESNIKKYGVLTCYLCGKPIVNNNDNLEHSTPLIRGGTNDFSNLGVAHQSCNFQKHIMTLDEWFNKNNYTKQKGGD